MSDTKVHVPLRYLVPGEDKPVYYASQGGADAHLDIRARFEAREVEIHNARLQMPAPSLDREGFTLVKHHTAIRDFYQLESERPAYESEIRDLLTRHTGARDIVVFDHTLRADSESLRGQHSTREPASVIHNDYTDNSAVVRLRDCLGEEQAAALMGSRFAIINTWRSIKLPVQRSPLCCCDAGSVSEAEFIATERRAADRIGELQLLSWNAAHRWYYYPGMERQEVLLLKTFDSALDGRARRSAHTAFTDPTTRQDAPPRESIESRSFVFY